MRAFTCPSCNQQRLFFENTSCENCGAALGFVPDELAFAAFDAEWKRIDERPGGTPQKPCANYTLENVCNWTLPADSPDTQCICCDTTDIIPALAKPENRTYWLLLERAKRRLFYSLLTLKLTTPSKRLDPEMGLSFHFLEEQAAGEKVLTGHADGVITFNIAEADDAQREHRRLDLHEPYRTLLGHFRHEIGHYYWSRLINDSPWLDECRKLFGDERADYGEALKAHYAAPKIDWQESFVSSYASSHPWEDWAECFAHYLHMQDGLETAAAWGLKLSKAVPGQARAIEPKEINASTKDLRTALVKQWLPVTQFINAMDRSLGTGDSYPFVLVDPVIEKLAFIHRVIVSASSSPAPAPAPAGARQTLPASPPSALPS